MSLFLLGIPLGLMGLYTMGKDVSYTVKDENIKNNNISTKDQKNKIDNHFIDIVKFCGAKCKIKNKKIYNIQKGEYGSMEYYLAKKGYNKEAIDYCKAKFDKLSEIEYNNYLKKIHIRVKNFEKALQFKETQYVTLNIHLSTPKAQRQIEHDVKKIKKYLEEHNNDAQVNIMMRSSLPQYNHDEIWIIKAPIGYDAMEYYFDVSELLGIE